ncbi:hypothetical protein VPH35_050728 [Triticum aestivum]
MHAVVSSMTLLLACPSAKPRPSGPHFPSRRWPPHRPSDDASPPPPLCVCGITQPLIIWPVPQVGHQMLRTCHIMLGYGGNEMIAWAASHSPQQLQIRGEKSRAPACVRYCVQ